MSEIPDAVIERALVAESYKGSRGFARVIAEWVDERHAQLIAGLSAKVEEVRQEVQAQFDEIEEEKNDLEESLEELTKEHEKLRQDCDTRIAQAVAAERAAVVAYLGRLREHVYSGYLIAGRIEAGEHVK